MTSYNYSYRDIKGNPAPKCLIIDGCQVWNPTAQMYAEQGYLPHTALQNVSAEPAVEQRIWELKAQLAESDYRVIKCSEAMLAGLPMPYDVAQLHAERQAIRDQINAFDNQ